MRKSFIKMIVVALLVPMLFAKVKAETNKDSVNFASDLNPGWNLGNTFDSFDTGGDRGEESWGNPKVTKELIKNVKKKGFKSIRIPFTTTMRTDLNHENYSIDKAYLTRYKEVVDWALEEDLYVMVNLHHDSWEWLANWDGSTTSAEYKRYIKAWEQLSELFIGYDERLIFESINEPIFYSVSDEQAALDKINDAFLDIIRVNHLDKYVVIPTYVTDSNQESLNHTSKYILDRNDPNIIATVHYYSEWVYSANLGILGFDQDLWGSGDYSSRDSMRDMFGRLKNSFIDKGIGVVIGEYGLLAYDKSDDALDMHETMKYIDEINLLARNNNISLMLWDNGQHLNRHTDGVSWHNEFFGERLLRSINDSTPYIKDFSYVFVSNEDSLKTSKTIDTRNLKLESIEINNQAYSLDNFNITENSISIKDGLAKELVEKNKDFTLNIVFEDGFKLPLYYRFVDEAEFLMFDNSTHTIPMNLNGHIIKSIESRNENGDIISNNNWWNYLERDEEFVLYDDKIIIKEKLWNHYENHKPITLKINLLDGSHLLYQINKDKTGHETNKTSMLVEIIEDGKQANTVTIEGYPGETYNLNQIINEGYTCSDEITGAFTKAVKEITVSCQSEDVNEVPKEEKDESLDTDNNENNVGEKNEDISNKKHNDEKTLPLTGSVNILLGIGSVFLIIGLFFKKNYRFD